MLRVRNKLFTAISLSLALSFSAECAAFAAEDAGQKTELVTKLNEYTIGELERPLTLKHLASLDMSAAWWTKMQQERGVHAMSFFTRDVLDFCKRMGWGDAYQFSNSGSGSKDEWKPHIENLLTTVKPNFQFEMKPDTQTCDNMNFDLSMRYLTSIGEILKSDWKPAAGAVKIVYVPSVSAKDISVSKTPEGTILVKAPINSEPEDWGGKLEKGFKRLSNSL